MIGPKHIALVDGLVAVGVKAGHNYERIPWYTVFQLAQSSPGEVGVGILTLFTGCANWGISFEGRTIGETLNDPARAFDPDEVRSPWEGPSRAEGKHVYDFRPGLGIPHIDSSLLRKDVYGSWGTPRGVPDSELARCSVGQIRKTEYRAKWDAWAERTVTTQATPTRESFAVWSVDRWLQKYWAPAIAGNETLELAAVNARVRNSASGIGRSASGLPLEEQIEKYRAYGFGKYKASDLARAHRSAHRCSMQAHFALRVGVIVEAARIVPVD